VVVAVVTLVAVGATVLGAVGGAFADATGPNLTGLWQWYAGSTEINAQFEITSGTSTQVRGFVDSAHGQSRNEIIDNGSIVGGQGTLYAYESNGLNFGYVITGIAGNTMTGFQYWDSFSATPSPPADLGTCETLQASNSSYACRAFTAIRLNPPVQSALSVAISPTVPPGGLPVGASLSVPITVAASGGSVSDISLGSGLTVGPSGTVKVTGVRAGASGFSLAQNQSRTFVYTIAGVKPGTAVLNATASGKGADGSVISQSATKSFPVVQKALRITMATQPGKVTLKADNAGKLAAKTVTVRLKATNTSKGRLTNVQLLSLSPVPADRTQQLDKLAFDRKLFPVKFGNIEGGANKVKTFKLKVTGDGTYVIDALALFNDPSQAGGNGRAFAEGGKFTVEAPLLYFTASNRHNFVVDGASWYVTGHVKNLSSFQTLCLLPLYPKFDANAGGLGPHDIRSAPTSEPAPPLAGPVKPGETIAFLMRVDTEVDGPTRSMVTLEPHAVKGNPGDACRMVAADKRPKLKGAQVKLAKDSTQFQVRVDKYRDKLGGGPGALEFFGAYAQSAYTVLGHLYESGLSLARAYNSVHKVVAALHHGSSVVLAQLYKAAAFASWFYLKSTEDERRQFFDQVKADFAAKTGQVWDGLQTSIQQSVGTWLQKVSDAYISGDWQALFHVLGEGAGTGLTETAIQMAEWELAIGAVRQTGTVARTINRYRIQSGILTALRAVPAGRILTFAEMQRLWGLALEDYQAFRRIAEEEGVLIGVRSRAPISVQNLEDGAVWKHEELKPKNVSDIDIDYLGFDRGDKGLVAFRTYTPAEEQAIRSKIANARLGKTERAAIVSRFETRLGEKEYVPKIEALAHKEQINVGFNYADNGIDLESTSNIRSFALDRSEIKGGGTYFRPLQENPKYGLLANGTEKLPKWCQRLLEKVLCRVSGDMDGVYLTGVDGRQLSAAKRIAVYKRLMEVGWQHPETLTWIKEGLFDFKSKSKILKGLELGGEPMMEFAPDGKVRATYLKLKNSNLNTISDYFVAVLGGYTSFAKTVAAR
jgi:hypothetical protein